MARHSDAVLSPLNITLVDFLVMYQDMNELATIPSPTVLNNISHVIAVVNGPRPGEDSLLLQPAMVTTTDNNHAPCAHQFQAANSPVEEQAATAAVAAVAVVAAVAPTVAVAAAVVPATEECATTAAPPNLAPKFAVEESLRKEWDARFLPSPHASPTHRLNYCDEGSRHPGSRQEGERRDGQERISSC